MIMIIMITIITIIMIINYQCRRKIRAVNITRPENRIMISAVDKESHECQVYAVMAIVISWDDNLYCMNVK